MLPEAFHEFIQHLKLLVHIDAQRLECTLAGLFDRVLFLLLRQKIQRILDHPAQLCRRVDAAALRISSVIAFASSSQYGSSEFS